MRRLLLLLAAAVPACVAVADARAGAWASHARPYTYPDLLVQGDTVWCATLEAGLLQFRTANTTLDSFEVWRHEPGGLASNHLTALAMGRDRRLWVGTDGAGLSRLSADRTHWDLISDLLGLPSNAITVLTAQGDSIWIGTDNGVAVWDGRTIAGAVPIGTDPSPFADNRITGVIPLGDSLWVSTAAGVYISRISSHLQSWSLDTAGFFAPPVQGLARAGNTVFALSNGAVYAFDPSTGRWGVIGFNGVPGQPGSIGQAVKLGGDNGALIASTSSGFWKWRSGNQWDLVSDAFASSTTDPQLEYATAVGPDGKIWAADRAGLLEQGSTPYDWQLHVPLSPPGNDILNLALQGSSVYVNTFAEGVGRYDGTSWYNWAPVGCSGDCDTTFLVPVFTFSLLVDARGHKWVGCWGGPLEEFDDSVSPTQFIHHFVDDPVAEGETRHTFGWAAINDVHGRHWFGLAHNGITEPIQALGIDLYDSLGNYVRGFRPDSVPSMKDWEVRALLDARLQGGRERILVGYSERAKGLQYVDPPVAATDTANMFRTVPGAESHEVIGLAQYGDSLWVLTTQDLGLYDLERLTLRTSFATAGTADRLPLHPLEVGLDGTVWIGSENGLRALHPGNRVEDFNVTNSPLLDNRVRAIRVDPSTGRVWIGTGGGINVFDPGYVPPGDTIPAHLAVQVYPNPVMITALGVSIRLHGNGSRYQVDVIDVRGRRVRHLDGVSNGLVFWNGRDDSGTLVRPGIYFIRAETGGRTGTARVALIR